MFTADNEYGRRWMKAIFKRRSTTPDGFGYKLLLAFGLMSVIPLLVAVYLAINYVFPQLNTLVDISVVLSLSALIAFLGFIFARKVIKPVVDMAVMARTIASGHYEKQIHISGNDEIAQLGESINAITAKVRLNIEEMKSYSHKAQELNVEIHRRMVVLAGLLQVSDVILSSTMEFKDILDLLVSKVSQAYDTGFAVLFLSKDSPELFYPVALCNAEHEGFDKIVIREGKGFLGKLLFSRSILVIDSTMRETKEIEEFKRAHHVKNLVVFPIFSGKDTFGILFAGNRLDNYKFSSDEFDIVKIFAKQIAIAVENNILVRKTKELALKDDLTNLFNRNYIFPRLDEEIKRALFFQRPCSFLMINVDEYRKFRDDCGEIASEEALKKIADILKGYVEPFGKAARIAGDEFALLLPEKNKRQSLEIAEAIRRKIESSSFAESQTKPLTVSIGVSENPIDGSTQEDIAKSAAAFLAHAKAQGKNRVVG